MVRTVADKAPLDEWVRSIGNIYLNVNTAKDPLDLWMQVINDTSILAEHIRRGQFDDAEKRLVKVFGWICSFVGKYLYMTQPIKPSDDFIGELLRKEIKDHLGVDESYGKWILKKYPGTCAKCGHQPCACPIYRREIEERKEKPEVFSQLKKHFQKNLKKAKRNYTARGRKVNPHTKAILSQPIDELINELIKIYGSGHYDIDIWKITAHLQEEIGEVALELLKLKEFHELSRKQSRIKFKDIVKDAITKKADDGLKLSSHIITLIDTASRNGDTALIQLFKHQAVAQLKEELADVFTWMAALLHKIAEARRMQSNDKRNCHFCDLLKEHCLNQAKTAYCRVCGLSSCKETCLVTTLTASTLADMDRV